jgi:hypothetical protein
MSKIAAILAWLILTFLSDAGACALCDAVHPVFLAIAGILFASFYSPVLSTPETS